MKSVLCLFYSILVQSSNTINFYIVLDLLLLLLSYLLLFLFFSFYYYFLYILFHHTGKQRVVISLVDHNVDKEFESLGTVVQIVDHHQQVPTEISSSTTESGATLSQDENYDQPDKEIVPGVGSCCSLVTKRYLNFLKATTSALEDNQNCGFDVQIALLLYGPVILGKCSFQLTCNF